MGVAPYGQRSLASQYLSGKRTEERRLDEDHQAVHLRRHPAHDDPAGIPFRPAGRDRRPDRRSQHGGALSLVLPPSETPAHLLCPETVAGPVPLPAPFGIPIHLALAESSRTL